MRSDLLSKRLFFGGLLGLPWLWIVHVLYFRGNQESDEGLINPDDHFQDEPAAAGNDGRPPEEIQREATKWVSRCQTGAIIAVTLWIGWIVTAQYLRSQGNLPSSLYFYSDNDAELTGW
uniref:Gamma-secretase subunit PEN-2 n=1 Tax=Entomoneis paludosa TaxID=265537 RepID=A0A7S3DXT4_9STRA|mmetsp:Transcript_8341/g.17363  ORF Transcript_8341/g.17363 Transcript_8341/m.17363 type:complete len:119 (+) Transcript_8341:140-496(+)|eukprot:CAMPEP_0172456092 /NCGR_PEP_ID=MMETSP1065-20121228/14182_1 /TAXON_ID=265537 /ORGANISM="Amphiprora paludosa, Strain CCMP125" /LENGTH=118 /DNA_ID=CAMNT_0013208763 /DNA_START=88 /DNA_END=441 /DNA_ORIENTATION=-